MSTFLFLLFSYLSLSMCYIGGQDMCKTESSNYCQSCNSGYLLHEGKCYGCPEGYVSLPKINGVFFGCDSCSPNCKECFNPFFEGCNKCKEGYFFDFKKERCSACKENCKKCRDDEFTSCTECFEGFYLDQRKEACLPCQMNCKQCTGSFHDTCLECSDGFYKGKTRCEPCYPGCKSCTGNTIEGCTETMDGFYLAGNQIDQCTEGCQTCRGPDFKGCSKCNEGYFMDTRNKICNKCPKNCEVCTGYNINSCISCKNGYYKDYNEKTCSSCMKNCNNCMDPYTCLECEEGFYIGKNMTNCTACPVNCLSCESDKNCTSCAYGYNLYNGKCKKFQGVRSDTRNGDVPMLAFSEIYNYNYHGEKKDGIYFKMSFYTFSPVNEGHFFNVPVTLKRWSPRRRLEEEEEQDLDSDSDYMSLYDNSTMTEEEFLDGINFLWEEEQTVAICLYNGPSIEADESASVVDYECYTESKNKNLIFISSESPSSTFISGWPTSLLARNVTKKINTELMYGKPATLLILQGGEVKKCSTYFGKMHFSFYGSIKGALPEKNEIFYMDLLQPKQNIVNCSMITNNANFSKIKCSHRMSETYHSETLVGTRIVTLKNDVRLLVRGNYDKRIPSYYCKYIPSKKLFSRGFGFWEALAITIGIIALCVLVIGGIYLYKLIKKLRKRANSYIEEQNRSVTQNSTNEPTQGGTNIIENASKSQTVPPAV